MQRDNCTTRGFSPGSLIRMCIREHFAVLGVSEGLDWDLSREPGSDWVAVGKKSGVWGWEEGGRRKGTLEGLNEHWNAGSAVKRSNDKKQKGGWLMWNKRRGGGRRRNSGVDLQLCNLRQPSLTAQQQLPPHLHSLMHLYTFTLEMFFNSGALTVCYYSAYTLERWSGPSGPHTHIHWETSYSHLFWETQWSSTCQTCVAH